MVVVVVLETSFLAKWDGSREMIWEGAMCERAAAAAAREVKHLGEAAGRRVKCWGGWGESEKNVDGNHSAPVTCAILFLTSRVRCTLVSLLLPAHPRVCRGATGRIGDFDRVDGATRHDCRGFVWCPGCEKRAGEVQRRGAEPARGTS